MPQLRLIFALHNHQPVGNFPEVFEACYRESYLPFLKLASQYPELSFVLHTSGPLMEWLAENHRDYVDALRAWCGQGRVEILGGAFHEPILSNIPTRDRIGQISSYAKYLEALLGQRVRGMWLPERVWEQSLVASIADAGMEYTVLDDLHFLNAGLPSDDLTGFFLTEDEGRLLKVFPNSERMRYLTPWQEPHETFAYLKRLAETAPGSVVVCADDGEKFGGWPHTHEHVYKNGWMRRFLDMLRANADWLETTTFARAVDETLPRGKCYLPDASYREMTEWVLPPDRLRAYRVASEAAERTSAAREILAFLRPGGFWRNFRVRYPEIDEMYCRMLGISERLDRLRTSDPCPSSDLDAATQHLYRAQCNCPYWHGAFGGLYLPHLRNAIYEQLIAAHACLDVIERKPKPRATVDVGDYNLDARQEVRLESDALIAWIQPARGGHLYELDDVATRVNLLATLDRRPEVYHQAILDRAAGDMASANAHMFKQEGLEQLLVYDRYPRKAFVDHFYALETTLADLVGGCEMERGDFATGTYLGTVEQSDTSASARLERGGWADGQRITVRKTFTMRPGQRGLSARYELSDLPRDRPIHFAVEINIASMAGGAPDRQYVDAEGVALGMLNDRLDISEASDITLSDGWRDLQLSLSWSQAGGLWAHPIETVSQSEGGYEAVYQSSAIVPHWVVRADLSGRWSVEIELRLGRAAERARVPQREALSAIA